MDRVFSDRKQHSPTIPSQETHIDQGETPLSTTLIKRILLSFITDYVDYMKELAFEVILWEERLKDSGASTTGSRYAIPTYEAIRDVSFIQTDVVYMQKNFGKNAIIIQIGISGLYASVNVFTFENPISEGQDKPNPIAFTNECEYVRKNIHLFSCEFPCVFDFL
jgi:hypothetical protein